MNLMIWGLVLCGLSIFAGLRIGRTVANADKQTDRQYEKFKMGGD